MIPTPQRHLLIWPEHGVEMAFRLIPAGSFRMGSRGYSAWEEPVHCVKIPEPFWMAETPATQAQFALWTRAERIKHENHFKGHPEHPAESMDWQQAVAFCAWLAHVKAGELPEGFSLVCLPTEAEWEYACRAGTETEYYSGDGEAALTEAAWFDEDIEKGSTHPVRRKVPNAFHVYDLHGNVDEWCHDAWDDSAYRQRVDGSADPAWQERLNDWRNGLAQMTQSDQTRVLRGGSWSNTAWFCRSALRNWHRPVARHRFSGFRVCLVRGPAPRSGAQKGRATEPAQGDGGRGTRPESECVGHDDELGGESPLWGHREATTS